MLSDCAEVNEDDSICSGDANLINRKAAGQSAVATADLAELTIQLSESANGTVLSEFVDAAHTLKNETASGIPMGVFDHGSIRGSTIQAR